MQLRLLASCLGLLCACAKPSAPASEPGSKASRRSATAAGCEAGALCGEYGKTCRRGDLACSCAPPCHGADMPEADHRNVWSCQTRPRACPESVPSSGAPCPDDGLVCGYGTCGGATARCQGETWNVLEYDPPPSADIG